jgi:hypothetical protein
MRAAVRQILFFATREDILRVLAWVEAKLTVQYVRTGIFESRKISRFRSGRDIPNLGQASADQYIACDAYLVCESHQKIAVRPVHLSRGGTRYAIDQMLNTDSVVFTPAGAYGEALINGRVATISDSSEAKCLMKEFARAFNESFTKVKAFMMGPAALEVLHRGGRLTSGIQSPAEYDLRVE